MFEAWNVAKGRKVQGGRILSQGTVCDYFKASHYCTLIFYDIYLLILEENPLQYKCLMSLVQLSYPIRNQNISLFYSNVCKQCKRLQTLYSLKTWIKLWFVSHGWSVLASIALSMNLRVVTFLQADPWLIDRAMDARTDPPWDTNHSFINVLRL